MERTLVIVKPDGVQRALVGPIVSRLEGRGLRLVGLKLVQVSQDLAARHYAEHDGKPFYQGLLSYITSAPVVVACVEGTSAIQMVRNAVGATDPLNAAPGTIRGDLATDIGRNLIHASDGHETAERELGLWFRPDELIDYARDVDRWVFEKPEG